jgi:hypothetical protein
MQPLTSTISSARKLVAVVNHLLDVPHPVVAGDSPSNLYGCPGRRQRTDRQIRQPWSHYSHRLSTGVIIFIIRASLAFYITHHIVCTTPSRILHDRSGLPLSIAFPLAIAAASAVSITTTKTPLITRWRGLEGRYIDSCFTFLFLLPHYIRVLDNFMSLHSLASCLPPVLS